MKSKPLTKRLLSAAMAFVLALSLLPATVFAAGDTPTTVTAWNYADGTTLPASGGTLSAAATSGKGTLSLSGGPAYTGYSSGSVSASGWTTDGCWLMTGLDTTGYKSLTFTASMRSSGTGPANFTLEYSVDGTTWVNVAAANKTATSIAVVFNAVALPAEAISATLSLRVRPTDTVSQSGGTVAAGGASGINNITLSGVPLVPINTIAEAKAGADSTAFFVKGVVNFVDGKNVYIQDETGGIDLFLPAYDANIKVGNEIKAAGTKSTYNGLVELVVAKAADYSIFSPSVPQQSVKKATVSELTADYSGAKALQSCRVKLTGLTLGTISTSGNTPATDEAGNTINLYKVPDLSAAGLKAGDKVNVTAVVGAYKAVQLRVVNVTDVRKVVTEDPITAQMFTDNSGAISLADVAGKASGATVTVLGQLVYRFGNNDTMNSVILEDVIDGEIVAMQVYNKLDGCNIGDVVKVTGVKGNYGGVDQIQGTVTSSVVKAATESGAVKIPAIEYPTLAAAQADIGNVLSSWVLIRNLTLSAYSASSITLTDANSATMTAYKPASYSAGLKEGSKVDLYACLSRNNGTAQLRIGSASDYVALQQITEPTLTQPALYPNAKEGKAYLIAVNAVPGVDATGASISSVQVSYKVGTAAAKTVDLVKNASTGKYEYTIPAAEVTRGSGTITLNYTVSDDQNHTATASAAVTVKDVQPTDFAAGTYFIYSASAAGVMKNGLNSGCAGTVAATVSQDGKTLTFEGVSGANGAASYVFTEQADGSYLIQCGSAYLSENAKKELYLSETAVNTDSDGSYWYIDYNDSLGGYTIRNSSGFYNSAATYMEFYTTKGFCAYTAESLSNIYAFKFFASAAYDNGQNGDVTANDGYVGKIPVQMPLPKNGGSYVIYNASGKLVIGKMNTDDGVRSMSGVAATVAGEGTAATADVNNGGLIFNVTTQTSADGKTIYYTFENNGKYLASDVTEQLFVQDTQSDNTQWTLENISGGWLIKNKAAAWVSSSGSKYPVYIEYFSGAFAGYSFKANSSDIFTFNFYGAEDTYGTGYVVNPKVFFTTSKDANLGVSYTVNFKLDDLGTVKTVSPSVTFSNGTTKTYTAVMDTKEPNNGSFVIPKADLEGSTSMTITVSATSQETATKDAAYSGTQTLNILDEPIIVDVTPAAGAQTDTNKRPGIAASFANCKASAKYEMTINGEKVQINVDEKTGMLTYQPVANMSDGKYTVNVTITRADGKVAAKTWAFYVGVAGVKPYFGQIHSHTAEYSDGSGTLEEAYQHASTVADMDFLIVTDHSNYFDTTSTATKDSMYDAGASSLLKTTDGSKTKWQEARETAAKYNTADFISAYGYEMTWSGGPGHMNVFNSTGIVSRNNAELNNKTNNAGMLAFYDLMVDANSKGKTYTSGSMVAQFNHPGTTFGTFGDFTGWSKANDAIIQLVEVGNGEGTVGSNGYFPSYKYYDQALTTGWHLAPTNNQDNHKGKWGDANTCRTVVLTDNFTEAGLYDAMSRRHVYSTEDQNLSIVYYLNDSLQGDVIDNYKDTKVHITASLSDADVADQIGTVSVIGENGKILYTQSDVTGNTYELDATLDNTSAYYYVKVVEKDGDIAVTAPVWVDEVAATKINAKAEVSGALAEPTVEEANTLTSVLTNTDKAALTLTGYTLTVDGQQVDAKSGLSVSVDPGKNVQYTYDWLPAGGGNHVVTVTFQLIVNKAAVSVTATQNIYVRDKNYNTVSTIAQAKAGSEKSEFTIEGTITANASGYDKNTAFFDCIYVQDGTAGINVFPVAGNYQAGQKVRLHGAITYYNGEVELNLSQDYGGYIQVISDEVTPLAPTQVNCKDAMSDTNIGLLMQVTGTVTRLHEASGIVDRIYVTDGTGAETCLYINGYIKNSVTKGDDFSGVPAVGSVISAIGLGSVDADDLNESSTGYFHRLRVRDRSEIVILTPAPQFEVLKGEVPGTPTGSYTVVCTAPIAGFTGIMVDGVIVDPSYYTAVSGSTRVTFTPAFMATLANGDHTVRFLYNDTYVDGTMAVSTNGANQGGTSQGGTSQNNGGVNTGDSSQIWIYGTAMVFTFSAGAYMLLKRKRDEK